MNKKGNATTAITLIVSLAFLLVLTVYIINLIVPFIWYQKLDNIANKYVYIIERFGYLTEDEANMLYEELTNAGFKTENIQTSYPTYRLGYGELFKFEIKYTIEQSYNVISNGIKKEARTIPLNIIKYSYSKI